MGTLRRLRRERGAFQGPPRIVRLHGRERAVQAGDPEFEALRARCGFATDEIPEYRRSIVVVSKASPAAGSGTCSATATGADQATLQIRVTKKGDAQALRGILLSYIRSGKLNVYMTADIAVHLAQLL